MLELVPNLRPGAVAGLTVSLIWPACKALSRGASFEFIQTLR